LIDRRLAFPTLRRLVGSKTLPDPAAPPPPSPSPPPARPPSPPPPTATPTEKALAYLIAHGLNQPAATGSTVEGIHVDLVYPQARAVVVFLDTEHAPGLDLDPLTFNGWEVMAWSPDDPFEELVALHPSVFGCVA
jgi:hypothetical protein